MLDDTRKAIAGVLLVFSTYFYFLIFAQFAFVEMALQSGASEIYVKSLMGAMAVGGLIGSFLVPLLRLPLYQIIRGSLLLCFFAGAGACLVPDEARLAIAALIGLSVGILTVSISSALNVFFASKSWGWRAALGTGLAYFTCNVPLVFQESPRFQSILAASICLVAVIFVPPISSHPTTVRIQGPSCLLFVVFFGILVWLDSAAFYIIQHSPLKEGSWSSSGNLWRNAMVHLAGAFGGGLLAQRRGFRPALLLAFALLAPGALLANSAEARPLAAWLYPAGVSVYSACLVAYPAFGISGANVAVRAAALYTVSGWICSGLGIGMAQNLQHVPWQFVAVCGILLVLSFSAATLLKLRREIAWAALIFLPAAIYPARPGPTRAEGRDVYLAEGCINCHSQYVRPGSRDELLWGPVQPIELILTNAPPLFGNRRQGPDLLNIGNRRSRQWLKEHFINPRALAPGSSMPSYAHLFRDARGEALLAYLTSLGAYTIRDRGYSLTNGGSSVSGKRLFAQHCAICHGPGAQGDGSLRHKFSRPPTNLAQGPWFYAPASLSPAFRRQQLARIIKFGLPGTNMPGHEYSSDEEVSALLAYLEGLSPSGSAAR